MNYDVCEVWINMVGAEAVQLLSSCHPAAKRNATTHRDGHFSAQTNKNCMLIAHLVPSQLANETIGAHN